MNRAALLSATCFSTALALLAAGCPDDEAPPPGPPRPRAPSYADEDVDRHRPWDDARRAEVIAQGKEVLLGNECNRCHVIDDLEKAARPLDCVSCHGFLKGLRPDDPRYVKIAQSQGEDVLKRYQANITHLLPGQVPDLTRLAARVNPRFIDRFLRAPFDLRPTLEESMIRPDLTVEERQAIVRYFAAVVGLGDPYARPLDDAARPTVPESDLAQGKALFKQKGCAVCHLFGNVDFGVTRAQLEAGRAANQLAPNLRFVRERTRHDVLVDWILEPARIKPGTTMPAMGLTREEAQKVASYLLAGEPRLKAVKRSAPKTPEVLKRPVTYAEMKERTLGKVCVHCHMNDYEKDPGPGNKGGLGYAGLGLSMRTYETLVAGALDEKGARYSVLEPREGAELPPIIEVLLLRDEEHWRDRVPAFADTARPAFPSDRKGMPLGLPSLTHEEKSILYTWIVQGCPGPAEVTGRPGVDDGFLVPDGPLAVNAGCGLRAPAKERPAWAVDQGAAGAVAAQP